MELFTIYFRNNGNGAQDAERFAEKLSEAFNHLHTRLDVELSVNLIGSEHGVEVKAMAGLPRFKLAQHGKPVWEAASRLCAEFALEQELRLLRGIIMREYQYKTAAELEAIEAYALQLLNMQHEHPHSEQAIPANDTDTADMLAFTAAEPAKEAAARRHKLAHQAFLEYLEENTYLILDGFVRFRLHAYMNELREVAEYAVDEYMMDQQYQEFISLLKYFVYIQEAKIPVAHLVHQGDREFVLLNEQLKPIETEQLDQFVVELIDKDVNYEDLIVSTLITVSPQKVYIHTRHPDMQVIRTIQQIFEERAQLCTYCGFCKPLLGDRATIDLLTP